MHLLQDDILKNIFLYKIYKEIWNRMNTLVPCLYIENKTSLTVTVDSTTNHNMNYWQHYTKYRYDNYKMQWISLLLVYDGYATFNVISVISWSSYWWRKR